jgi:hypothetical protein
MVDFVNQALLEQAIRVVLELKLVLENSSSTIDSVEEFLATNKMVHSELEKVLNRLQKKLKHAEVCLISRSVTLCVRPEHAR